MSCEGKFAHLLYEAVRYRRQLAPVAGEKPDPRWDAAVLWIAREGRDRFGWYGNRWDTRPARPWREPMLIDQASIVRALWQMNVK